MKVNVLEWMKFKECLLGKIRGAAVEKWKEKFALFSFYSNSLHSPALIQRTYF